MATNNEEIIERKEGSPVATSLLVIAALAIVGAITLQLMEVAQNRVEYQPGEKLANQVQRTTKDARDIHTTIDDILNASLPLGDETGKKRVADAKERAEKIKKDALAEAESKNESAGGTEGEESPEEPVEKKPADTDEAEEPAEEPAEDSTEAEEAPEEPAEEDAGEKEDPLGDL